MPFPGMPHTVFVLVNPTERSKGLITISEIQIYVYEATKHHHASSLTSHTQNETTSSLLISAATLSTAASTPPFQCNHNQVLSPVEGAAEFLDSLDIPYNPGPAGGEEGGETGYIDVEAGKILEKPELKDSNATAQALLTYIEQLSSYPDLENGFWLPDPVPEDLLFSFTEYARKYGMERAVGPLSIGMGDFWSLPVLYAVKHYGRHIFRNKFL